MIPTLRLAVPALLACAGFAAGWHIQQWRFEAKEADRAKQDLVNVQLTAAASIRRQDNVIEAQNAATARMGRLQRDSRAARTELERLRLHLSTSGTSGEAACATSDQRANAAQELLSQCAGAYSELAATADRHASDTETLMDAWPGE